MSFDLSDLMGAIMDSSNFNVRTALPAIVERIKTSNGKTSVDVKIAFKELYIDKRTVLDQPIISDVPIGFVQGDNYKIHVPINSGDSGLLIICGRDISKWKEFGSSNKPNTSRLHNISDGIFLPINTKNNINSYEENKLVIDYNGNSISIDSSGNINIDSSNDLNITSSGDVTINCNTAQINASETHLGSGGQPIARVGDQVTVGSDVGTITSGGTNTSI